MEEAPPWVKIWKLHKSITTALKNWNFKVFGHIQEMLTKVEEEVLEKEKIIADDTSEMNQVNYDNLLINFQQLIDREEDFWR